MIELTNSEAIGLGGSIIAAMFAGLRWMAGGLLDAQKARDKTQDEARAAFEKRLHERLDAFHSAQGKTQDELRELEKRFDALRADLPEKYVLRDDFVRAHGELRISLDALRLQIENHFLRWGNRGS